MRATGPQEDQVHRKARWLHANEGDRSFHITLPGELFTGSEDIPDDEFRLLHARS